MDTGRRRPGGDTWIALGLIAANALFLHDLFNTEPGGAYLKTTTLPIALSVTLTALSVLLLVWSLVRPDAPAAEAAGPAADRVAGPPPAVRVLAATLLTAGYIAALPWFGYMLSSAAYFAALSLLYGNRNPVSIVAVMVAVPLALMLFFEEYMIVLLPSAALFE